MTSKERNTYRETLLELLHSQEDNLAAVAEGALHEVGGEASGSLSNAPLHLADLGTNYSEQEVSANLLQNGLETLQQIREALGRLDDGSFGQCQECGREIPARRLQVMPYAAHCVECAQRLQEKDAQQAR